MIHGIYFNYKDIEGKEEKMLNYLKNENINTVKSIYMASPLFSYIYNRIDKKYPNKKEEEKIQLAAIIYSNNFEKINNEIDSKIDENCLSINSEIGNNETKNDIENKYTKSSNKNIKNNTIEKEKNDLFNKVEEYLDKHISKINDYICNIKKTVGDKDKNLAIDILLNDKVVYKLFFQILYRNCIIKFVQNLLIDNINNNENKDISNDEYDEFEIFNRTFYNILLKYKNIDRFYDLFNNNLILDEYIDYLFNSNNIDKMTVFLKDYRKIKTNINILYMKYIIKNTNGIEELIQYNKLHFINTYYENKDSIIEEINKSYSDIFEINMENDDNNKEDFINKIKESINKVIIKKLRLNNNFTKGTDLINFLLDLIKLYTIIPNDVEEDYGKIDLVNELNQISDIVIFNRLDDHNIRNNDIYIKNKYNMFKTVISHIDQIKKDNDDLESFDLSKKNILKLCMDLNKVFDDNYNVQEGKLEIGDIYIMLTVDDSLNNKLYHSYINNSFNTLMHNISNQTKTIKNNKNLNELLEVYKKVSNELLTNHTAINIIFKIVNDNLNMAEKMYQSFSNLIIPNNKNRKILNDFILIILEIIFSRKNIFENRLKIKKINDFIFYDPKQFLYISNLILVAFNKISKKDINMDIDFIANIILNENKREFDNLIK